jgi:hypothetical protein
MIFRGFGLGSEAAQPGRRSYLQPVQLTTAQDHQRTMELLHITALRQGANGSNPKAENYANYDESKANPYPNLPDPLLLKNGKRVTKANDWWKSRRPEIVEDFDREVYGRVPKATPTVQWKVAGTTNEMKGEIPVVTKKLVGYVDNASYPLITVNIQALLTTPADAITPVPVLLEFGFLEPFPGAGSRAGAPAPKPAVAGAPKTAGRGAAVPPGMVDWQEMVLSRGWGYAILDPNSVQADNGAGLTQGIIGLGNKGQPRMPDDWGALRAWAWGASRLLDYLERDKAVDAKQVAVEGMSRYGKATIVAMAYDRRFAIAFVGSSGAGGVKLHRRNWGELVENVAAPSEYHWMAGNYLKYAGPLTWNDLPVDSHELVALCAPRPVFVGAGATNGDGWVDAKGMFLAEVGAGPVYKLLGEKDLGVTEFPPVETELISGALGFRQHTGGHTSAPNWPTFLKFADRYMFGSPLPASAAKP